MKVNVSKLQAGGSLVYQPLPMIPTGEPQVAGPEVAAKEEKEETPYLDKTTLNKMLGDGVTNDVMAYSEMMQKAYQEYATMNDFQKNSYKGRQLRGILKGDIGQLNALVRAKTTLDNSIKQAASNAALEEFAVTGQGMVVKDSTTGKITTISFSQYASDNNSENKRFQALTNAQLAEEREYNKQLIGNSAVFSVLNYGKGMEKIKDEVLKIVNTIGSTKNSVTNGQYQPSDREDINQLIQAAKQGTFKMKSGESVETNAPQIERAKQTMWLNLSDNSKNVLRARAASQVTNPSDIEKMAASMAASLLDPHLETSVSKVYDESLNAGRAGANGSNKMADTGPTEAAFMGRSNAISISQIGPGGTNIQGVAYALPPQLYTDKDNLRVPLSNAGKLNSISYLSKAFVGNGDKVIPDNTVIIGDAYYATLPVTKDENGNMRIDEDGAKKWAMYEEELKTIPTSQRSPMKESELKNKYGVQHMKTERLIVAEAASYADEFFDSRDKRYYGDLDSATKNKLGEIVDPKQKGPRSWFDNSAHKHLVFIPAKDHLSARAADGNSARLPESVYDLRQFNTGANGANISQGQPMGGTANASQLGLTADVWK